MMDRRSRHRLSKLDKLVSTALKEREESEKQVVKQLPYLARHHATAVAAIVLSGQPKIDEPLIGAWGRALQHYGINVNALGGMNDPVRAAQQLLPIIIGGESYQRDLPKYLGRLRFGCCSLQEFAWMLVCYNSTCRTYQGDTNGVVLGSKTRDGGRCFHQG